MDPKLIALLVWFSANFKICQSKKYEEFALYNVVPTEEDHLRFLQNLEAQKYIDITFWRRPLKLYYPVQFIVNPTDIALFMERVHHFKLKPDMLLSDIQKAFDNQTIGQYSRFRADTYSWEHYHTLEDIYQWLSDMADKYSGTAKLVVVGKSFEKRDIYALVAKRGSSKSKVIVEGGSHGSEWISTEFVTYLAYHLITCNETNHRLLKLARSYEWYLIPVLNPDGFAYSQKVDRLFRKNRNTSFGSTGVDLNRNFDYSFGQHATAKNVSDDNYCGATAFSEPETKALKTFVKQMSKHIKFYFSMHGYGQKIIIPYADRVNHIEDYTEMENYGKQAILKMYKLYGRKYSVGTFYDTMGLKISGNSASWVKKNLRIKYVFTFLLRDNGTYGYALPPSEIAPACQEATAGLVELMLAKPRRVRSELFDSALKLNIGTLLFALEIVILILQ